MSTVAKSERPCKSPIKPYNVGVRGLMLFSQLIHDNANKQRIGKLSVRQSKWSRSFEISRQKKKIIITKRDKGEEREKGEEE